MPPEIHTLVENADNVNAVGGDAIEQKVRPGAIFIIFGSHLGAWPSARRTRSYDLDVARELAEISLGLIEAPAAFCVAPDFLQV